MPRKLGLRISILLRLASSFQLQIPLSCASFRSLLSRRRLARQLGAHSTVNMPTPESELFKSQKPKVPPTFNGVDYDDTKAFKAAEDAVIREQWVGAMMVRLVGEELGKCYRREGVNHLENCGHLRERYLQLLSTNKIKGTKFLQQNYLSKKEEELDLEAGVHPKDKIARINQGRFSS